MPTYIFLFVYLSICNIWLYESRKKNKVNGVQLLWLRFLYGMFLVVIVGYTLMGILQHLFYNGLYTITQFTHIVVHAFFINGLLFLTLKYPDIISKKEYLKNRIAEAQDDKYAYSNLDESDAERILKKLEKSMAVDKIYKMPGLTLESLGEQLAEEPKYLSQSINQLTGKNFKEYINEMRIGEAARLFADAEYKNWRINEVMYDTGFRSKSSFNSNFKKYTGYTPTEYRQQY